MEASWQIELLGGLRATCGSRVVNGPVAFGGG